MARMAGLSPGTSPPPVSIAIVPLSDMFRFVDCWCGGDSVLNGVPGTDVSTLCVRGHCASVMLVAPTHYVPDHVSSSMFRSSIRLIAVLVSLGGAASSAAVAQRAAGSRVLDRANLD